MAKDNFPVNETRIIKDMRDNKNFYWEKFYLKLKPITAAFCYQMSGIAGDNNIHDIWSDTCISVNRAVVERRLKEPVDSKAVISYSVGVLKIRTRNLPATVPRPLPTSMPFSISSLRRMTKNISTILLQNLKIFRHKQEALPIISTFRTKIPSRGILSSYYIIRSTRSMTN